MGYTNSSLVTYKKISPNKTSPRQHVIDTITIHCIVGQWTAKQGCDYFATAPESSANYVVGKDGSIGLSVEEKDRAWTTGGTDKNGNPIRVNGISGRDNDHRAITIEVASDTTHPYAVTDKALDALIELVADICKRNNIKQLKWEGNKSLVGQTSRQNMTVHRWFANKACPGDYLYNRHSYIAEQVNKKISPSNTSNSSSTSNPEDKGYLTKGDTGSAVKTMQTMLIACGYPCGVSGADGSFGNDTLASLKAYQKANGLEVDGYYGSKTKASLTAKYNSLKNGSSKLIEVDGKFGKATILASQKYFGTKQDGKISNQPFENKKYLEAAVDGAWEFKVSGYSAGSSLIVAMQRKFGTTADGYFGKGSVMAMQKWLNAKGYNCGAVDGYMGAKTVKAWQLYLNNQK